MSGGPDAVPVNCKQVGVFVLKGFVEIFRRFEDAMTQSDLAFSVVGDPSRYPQTFPLQFGTISHRKSIAKFIQQMNRALFK